MSDNNKKFFFDLHDFQKEADQEKEKRKAKAPPPPSFSLEDMEAARHAALAKGKDEGIQMAKDSIEQQTELVVQSLADQIRTLETAEEQRYAAYLDQTVAISYKALEKILPGLLDVAKIDLMKQALNDFYMQTSTKGNLTLFIHPSMRDAMERHAKSLSATLSVEEDERMSPAQARIEWTNGAFEFTPDLLMEQILQTLQGRLSENDQILDDNQKNPHTDEENRDKEQDL